MFLKKFCAIHGFTFSCHSSIDASLLVPGKAYLVFRQKELVELMKFARSKGLVSGKDYGIVAYNNIPLYQIIDNGITSISADFGLMGSRAAHFVSTRQAIQEIIPTNIYQRESL